MSHFIIIIILGCYYNYHYIYSAISLHEGHIKIVLETFFIMPSWFIMILYVYYDFYVQILLSQKIKNMK